MKTHPDGTVAVTMGSWMVTMTTVWTGALEGVDPLTVIEVGVVPNVVMWAKAHLLSQ